MTNPIRPGIGMAQNAGRVIGLVIGFLGATLVIATYFLFSVEPFIYTFAPILSAILVGLAILVWRESRTLNDQRIAHDFKIWTLIGSLTGVVTFYLAVTLKNPLIVPPVMLALFFLTFRSKRSSEHLFNPASLSSLNMSDDQKIVALASELCQQLGITRFTPIGVVWFEWNPVASSYMKEMPPDIATFYSGHICLASRVKEKLDVEDWRRIIASSLIFSFDPQVGARKLTSDLRWTLVCLASLGSFALVGRLIGGFFSSLTVLFLAAFLLVPVAWIFAVRTGKTLSSRLLRADLKAADLLGRENLLSTLNKIDSLRLPEVEKNNELRANRSIRSRAPSLAERINNLHFQAATITPL